MGNLSGCSNNNGTPQNPNVPGDAVTIKGKDSVGLEFALNSSRDGYQLVGLGTCTDNVLIIPSKHLGLPVDFINSLAFPEGNNITEILLPNTIKSISSDAFRKCNNLINIEISPDNQYYKSIGGNLYSSKGNCLIQYALGKEAEHFVLPDHVEIIY